MSCLPVTELEGYGAYKQFGYALASLDYDKVSFGTTIIWYFFGNFFVFIFLSILHRMGFQTFSSRRHSRMMQIKVAQFIFLTVFTN